MAVLSGCNNSTQGDLNDPIDSSTEEMGFLIKLPGEANGKARTAYYQSSDAVSYKVTVKFNKEIIDTKTGLHGETLKVIVSEEGTYDFSVFAYDKTGTVIGGGNTSSRTNKDDTYTFTVDLSKIDKTQMKGVGKDFGTDGEKIITVDDEVDLSDYTPYVLALSDTKGEGYISDLWGGRIVRMNEGGTFPETLNPIP